MLAFTSFWVAFASALLPFVNIEVYLAGIAAVGPGQVAALAIATGAGQTLGKLVWYEGARRGVDTAWMRRKLEGPKVGRVYGRWLGRMQGRPWYAGGVLLLAGSVGIPPMLVLAAVAGALKMPRWVFVPTVFLGRTIRFWAILAGVGLFVD
ncbi:hypothetical protein [Nocardioides insulae]|uniref:hypothetical protein n=1 Tax=Nocardioides insulae TaxID=394734 RepID=UPI00040F0292|nr:hypothetical protein [Nocardioides insulae]